MIDADSHVPDHPTTTIGHPDKVSIMIRVVTIVMTTTTKKRRKRRRHHQQDHIQNQKREKDIKENNEKKERNTNTKRKKMMEKWEEEHGTTTATIFQRAANEKGRDGHQQSHRTSRIGQSTQEDYQKSSYDRQNRG